jgi:hypothetical protein
MWLRIAAGAGIFLVGYILGRGFQRLDEKQAASPGAAARIRDELAQNTGEQDAAPAAQSGDNIVREE